MSERLSADEPAHGPTVPKVRTQVPGLDTLLQGGLPAARATLVAGKAGAFKSILALQIACNAAREGRDVVFVTVEERSEDLRRVARQLGFPLAELEEARRLHVLDVVDKPDAPIEVTGDYDLEGFIHRIVAAKERTRSDVVVVDSMTALFGMLPGTPSRRQHFFRVVHALTSAGATAILTSETADDYGDNGPFGMEDFVCDVVLRLRNVQDGKRRRRTIEVCKYRCSDHYKGEYPCTITPRGVTVFPLDDQERQSEVASDRYPSGLPGLDEMTGGGWLRDSIVLARGPSGSGKTTLATMYARAGALRGERVFYYGFEETKPILLRNTRSLGMPLDELEERGLLKVTCQYPEATSTEDMIIELRTVLDEYKPSMVVLDSISSIEHVSSYESFRHFVVGVASALRQHGRSAFLTQTTSMGNRRDDLGAPYLSTLADAIVLLDYELSPRGMDRTIRVVKMRGSEHAQEPRRLHLTANGLQVGALPPSAARARRSRA